MARIKARPSVSKADAEILRILHALPRDLRRAIVAVIRVCARQFGVAA